MAHTHHDLSHEVTRMRPAGRMAGVVLMAGGAVAVIAAYLSALGTEGKGQRFWFAYLFGLAAITAVSCASLIFTLVNHLVRTGWITNVRRILETMAVQMVLVLVLALPVIGLTLTKSGTLYSWAKPSDTPIVHHEEGGEEHGEGHEATTPGHAPTAAGAHGEAAKPGTPEAGAEVPADKVDAKAVPAHDAAETAKIHAGERLTAQSNSTPDATPESPSHADIAKADQTKQAEHNDPDIKRENDDTITYPNEQVRPGVQRDFDENIARKNHIWLNPLFWSIRVLAYLAVLSGIAWFYWSSSVKQDATGDLDVTDRMFTLSAPLTFVSALCTTFIAFDVFMSLDPHWFSTMYGVYFFASGTQAMWAIISLFVLTLQARGYIRESVTQEHRHDLGKFLWAFIVFWTYIAYSQYMLQWYANLPEETFFFDKRGYSQAHPNGYTPLVIALLVGRFVVPFLGLVSRHVKRNRFGLGFWSVWLLVFFVVDIYVLILPEYSWKPLIGLPEILAFLGIAGLWLGNVVRVLGAHELRAVRDPRVHESLALQNY